MVLLWNIFMKGRQDLKSSFFLTKSQKELRTLRLENVPFNCYISLQLTAENVTFVENYSGGKYILRILEFPQLAHYQLKDMLVSCDVILDMDSNMWKVTYHFKKIHLTSNNVGFSNESVLYFYESDNVAEKLLGDWEGLCKLFEIAVKVEETMEGIET